MTKIMDDIEKNISLGNELLKIFPSDRRLQSMLLGLEELKGELSKPKRDINKFKHLCFAVTRNYTDMLDYENTPFGIEMKKLLLILSDLYHSN